MPAAVVTVTLTAPRLFLGAVTLSSVALADVISAFALPNFTVFASAVAPKSVPLIVTASPMYPDSGEMEVIDGAFNSGSAGLQLAIIAAVASTIKTILFIIS